MSASASSILDLAQTDHWRGLWPGMTRAEAESVIAQAAVETYRDPDDPGELEISDWELDLLFGKGDEQVVRQIGAGGRECVWEGKPIVGGPLHEALFAVGPALVRGAGWRPEGGILDCFEDLAAEAPKPASDVALLNDGTLWLPLRSLGLVMCGGMVNEIAWRQPHDVPTQFVGGITEAQLRLSQHPDLAEHLLEKGVEESAARR